MKRYKVTLDAGERQHLHDLIAAGKAAARKLAHARILLKADAADGGPGWTDDLNTHDPGCLYEAFEPDRARRIVEKLEWHYTPKHGSWLNVAECELSCMTSQCLKDRRIGDLATLQTEIAAWSVAINKKQRAVDWQFTIDKARVKLKRLYPNI